MVQPYISFLDKILRNLMLKTMAGGFDQCVWSVGVITEQGHWKGYNYSE